MDVPVRNARLSELGTGEERVVRAQEARITAPVHIERPLGLHVVLGPEIGVHVGPAKRVDRLLGIADQDKGRPLITERAVHDLPLDGIGVLELVDENDVVAFTQASARDSTAGRVA